MKATTDNSHDHHDHHSCQKRHLLPPPLLILIMIAGPIKRVANLTLRPMRCFSPAGSQFQIFREHMQNIDDQGSMREAAQLLATLEHDQQRLNENIAILENEIDSHSQQHPLARELISRRQLMQIQINRQLIDNQEIEARAAKEVETVKIYGISRVAKKVIETADFIREAIKAQEQSRQGSSELASLKALQEQLATLLGKHGIVQFSPLRELFDPNQHESIGHLPSSDPKLINTVGEVKRTGFKIGERLLRPAYVLIHG